MVEPMKANLGLLVCIVEEKMLKEKILELM